MKNINKKLLIISFSFLFVGLVFTRINIHAQNQEVVSIGEVSNPGILPDSPFYFLKDWGRRIRMFFTFDSVKKAELELKFVNEDVLIIRNLCDKGKCALAEKLSEKFQERYQKVIQRTKEAKQEGKNVEVLVEKLKENHLRQQQVLADVLEKAPEQAKEGILKAVENSAFGLENAIENVQGRQKMKQFREELNLQIRNMGEEKQLRIQERLERKSRQSEELPVDELQQKELKYRETGQGESRQQEKSQQQESGQRGQGQRELKQQGPNR